MKEKLLIFTFFILNFSFLTACTEIVLLQDLEQRDANEIMVMLARNGIEAKKKGVEKQQTTTWTITVLSGDETRARELLVANNLPRQRELGLSGVCKESGLIPTPKMEKCRELLALKGEIINSLESIPTVVDADVVLNMPDKQDFPDENNPAPRPTASVVIQVDTPLGETMVIDESKVQQFVANSVSGMDVRDVAVIITRSSGGGGTENQPDESIKTAVTVGEEDGEEGEELEEEFSTVGGLLMDPGSARKFKLIMVLGLVVVVALSGTLIAVLLKMARGRKTGGLPAMVNTHQPALPDKAVMDNLVNEAGQAGRGPRRTV